MGRERARMRCGNRVKRRTTAIPSDSALSSERHNSRITESRYASNALMLCPRGAHMPRRRLQRISKYPRARASFASLRRRTVFRVPLASRHREEITPEINRLRRRRDPMLSDLTAAQNGSIIYSRWMVVRPEGNR